MELRNKTLYELRQCAYCAQYLSENDLIHHKFDDGSLRWLCPSCYSLITHTDNFKKGENMKCDFCRKDKKVLYYSYEWNGGLCFWCKVRFRIWKFFHRRK